jgi:hypothetical protein
MQSYLYIFVLLGSYSRITIQVGHTPVIIALKRLRQEDYELEAGLGNIARSCL